MNNIILIGMPASGKSTAGVILAKILGYGFLDTDILLQETAGHTLQEIIGISGMKGFLELEERTLLALYAKKTVIATGGSAVYSEKAMEHLRGIGKTVYLKAACGSIEERLGNIVTRGVVMKPAQTIREIYEERVALYAKYADITVDADTESIERTAENIIEKLEL